MQMLMYRDSWHVVSPVLAPSSPFSLDNTIAGLLKMGLGSCRDPSLALKCLLVPGQSRSLGSHTAHAAAPPAAEFVTPGRAATREGTEGREDAQALSPFQHFHR